MTKTLTIWILDPFHTQGPMRQWSLGAKAFGKSRAGHRVAHLPGRHWKWRMHGAAAIWAH